MAQRPLILLTNDDGVHSPGLHAAVEALADIGDLLIMAPSTQQTGAGRGYLVESDKTIYQTEILINSVSQRAYHATVSPAQAVALAVLELAQRPIDLCVSGINYGENIGSGVTISGTVGAALEAACYNIPALAASFETPHEYHLQHSREINFAVSAHFTRLFAQKILAGGLPPGVDLLKIDVPASATPTTPWRVTRISRQRYYQSKVEDYDPQTGQPKKFSYYVNVDHAALEPESDIYVFAVEKQVAVVPMSIDLTAPVPLADVAQFFSSSFPED